MAASEGLEIPDLCELEGPAVGDLLASCLDGGSDGVLAFLFDPGVDPGSLTSGRVRCHETQNINDDVDDSGQVTDTGNRPLRPQTICAIED